MIDLKSLITYGRIRANPEERRLKINNTFRRIISDCIFISDDLEDMLKDLYRMRKFRNSMDTDVLHKINMANFKDI